VFLLEGAPTVLKIKAVIISLLSIIFIAGCGVTQKETSDHSDNSSPPPRQSFDLSVVNNFEGIVSGNSFILSWSKPADSDVSGYKMYYSTYSDSNYQLLADITTVNTTTFTITNNIQLDTPYYFTIRTRDSYGNYSTINTVPAILKIDSAGTKQYKIVYTRDKGSGVYEIWIMNIDGSNKTKLTKGKDPYFSKDGKKIVYDHGNNIFTINTDGTNKTDLTSPYGNWGRRAAFSNDGNKIVYIKGINGQLHIMDADGSNSTDLDINLSGVTNYPSFSNLDLEIIFNLSNFRTYRHDIMQALRQKFRTPIVI